MPDNDRKTSEDMIRDARGRLGEPGMVPTEGFESNRDLPPVDTSADTPESNPDQPEHVYRSQTEVIPQPAGADPIGYPPSQPRYRVNGRLITWAIIVALGLGWGLFTSLDDAERNDSGDIVTGGDLNVMTIQLGDCFDDPDETGVVYNLDAIPCSEPHDNEVFATDSVAGVWSEYPGQSAIDSYAYDRCTSNLFDDFVGTPYLDSLLDVFTLTPTPESWDQGDREIICALYRLDYAKLSGTARDSRL